jgi:RES domain
MAFGPPPDHYRGRPARYRLEPGTVLWRVQSRHHEARAFKSRPADRLWGGGRFDCTADDWYPYLYAGLTQETALAETLLRDRPFPGNGHKRTVPAVLVAGKQLHALELIGDLELISLMSAPDLAAIRQEDGWLVEADGKDYAFTRAWAHWLRRVAPRAQGIIWNSRRNLGQPAVALFGDRCPPDALRLAGPPSQALDDEDGTKFLNDRLAPYHARVCPPRSGYRSVAC